MNSYQEFEKTIFNWLMSKHKMDSSFVFSMRQVASKGAERDYFIGKERSNYFGTTFWSIHVNYPGSSSDLFNLFFTFNDDEFDYYFYGGQTRNPHNEQNRYNLQLVKNSQIALEKRFPGIIKSSPKNKMESFRIKSRKTSYTSIEDLINDIELDLKDFIVIIDKEIKKLKEKHPSYVADRFTKEQFIVMVEKMKTRQSKHQLEGSKQLLSESNPEISKISKEDNIDDTNASKSLNTIFYGPPGTGKTYKTIIRAAEIVENRSITSYKEALEVFKSNLHDQIEFITFHQNYSYEDFIQGLRPDTDNDNGLLFEKKDGVFKKIADRALKNITESEKSPVIKKPFDETFSEYIRPLTEGEVEEIEVKMRLVSFYITAITKHSIEFRKASGGTSHTLSLTTLRKMYEAESVMDIQGLTSYYTPLLEKLLQIGVDSTGKKKVVSRKNYVIIIDEINRANISRVFGELITLIEKDKRSHGEIPMEVRLPSGDKFIVPSNLYIIGTMNTADKSIALLDIALRRRFEFEPMYPLYEISDGEIYDADILKSINTQIIKSKGRDFQIGHSFFMGENKDLIKRMNNKVIPLLLEYYMNDEKEVRAILQTAGLVIEEDSWPIRITSRK